MKKGIISVIICLLVLGLAIGYLQFTAQTADKKIEAQNISQTSVVNPENNVQEESSDIEIDQTESTTTDTITVQSSLPARTSEGNLVIGAEDAPVTITEYSSLSCSHCASFHKNTLSDLKKDYIDAGIVKMIFSDFPTNEEAMDASKLLRCVPTNDRYQFMNLLFEQQLQWAHPSVDHRQKLLQYAALIGLSNDKASACMNDKDVENNIIAGIQSANSNYNVSSTPTFLIEPSEEILVGARPYGDFSTKIENLTK